jgi:hypothetical protein
MIDIHEAPLDEQILTAAERLELQKIGLFSANELRVRDPLTPRWRQLWKEEVADRLDAGGWACVKHAPLGRIKGLLYCAPVDLDAWETSCSEARAIIAVYGELDIAELEEYSDSPAIDDQLADEILGWARRLRYTRFNSLGELPEPLWEVVIHGLG